MSHKRLTQNPGSEKAYSTTDLSLFLLHPATSLKLLQRVHVDKDSPDSCWWFVSLMAFRGESALKLVFKSKHIFIAKRCLKYFHLENEGYLCLFTLPFQSAPALSCFLHVRKIRTRLWTLFPEAATPQKTNHIEHGWLTAFYSQNQDRSEVVAKTRMKKKKVLGKRSSPLSPRAELASRGCKQAQFCFLPPLHSWVVPPSDVPITDVLIPQCSEQLTVYLTHMYLVLRVTALPGQHFSHFSSKSSLTNPVCHPWFSLSQIGCSINTKSQWVTTKANDSAPGWWLLPAWGANDGWTTWNGCVRSNTSPQWDTLGNVDPAWRDTSPRRGGWSQHSWEYVPI